MTLTEKIVSLYPDLTNDDFNPIFGKIILRNDGNGDYIKEWNHATFNKPTQDQLDNMS